MPGVSGVTDHALHQRPHRYVEGTITGGGVLFEETADCGQRGGSLLGCTDQRP
jgi:hypothetical protein